MNALLCKWYPESCAQGFTSVDGTVAFYNKVIDYARDAQTIVDLGCGRGKAADDTVSYRRSLCDLRRPGRLLIGLDVDPIGADNPFIDKFKLIRSGEPLPVESGTVDVIVADWVMEHLEKPQEVFREAARILRTGGVLCLRTLNLHGYIGTISRITPNSLHGYATKFAQGDDRKIHDVFPTYYRANTARQLRNLMHESHLDPTILFHEPEPAYSSFSGVAFALGVLYQRHAPAWMKNVLFAFGRKI